MPKNFNTANYIKAVDTFQRKLLALHDALDEADSIDGVSLEDLQTKSIVLGLSHSFQAVRTFYRAIRLARQVREANDMLGDVLDELRDYTREALFEEIAEE
jgi:hypothetical protein